MRESEDLSGRRLGEFVLRERIGRGGFGAVYRCEQPLLGREAVVKVLHQRLRHNDVVLQRFVREAQLASRLDHPYAAHIYAFGIDHGDGLFWIAMELVQGTTLDRWLGERGPLALEQLVPLFERVAEVVQTAHERGIVHRDLKPSNVMVIERAGRLLPKLLDFGVAKLVDGADAGAPDPRPGSRSRGPAVANEPGETPGWTASSDNGTQTGSDAPRGGALHRLTHAGATLGSPPYMSPEQWDNAQTVGPGSDLYALGVMAYEALTGRRPFQGATPAEYDELHCHAAVPPLGTGFSPALDRMFQRALAKRPEDRWATALELAAALRAASGLGNGWADLPRVHEAVRDAWLADGPQPLAESIAALEGARNAHQALASAEDVVRNLVRYVLAIALATHAQVRADSTDPALVELVRTMRQRDLQEGERVGLLRVLVRPLISRRGAHPVPELVDLVAVRADGSDGLDPILALHATTDHAGSEDAVRARLGRLVPELTQLLRKMAFVLDHVLVVPRGDAAERWSGLRRPHRALVAVQGGELVEGHPMLLDRDGRVCVDLWPVVQAVSPTEGAEPELFVFEGRGRHGARLIAAPAGFEHHDAGVWEWIGARVIAAADANPDVVGDDQAPYLGLMPFATTDAARFVGREAEVDAFLNRLRQRPLQVVVGPSGAGKSSFVHAGVIPGLPASWRTVTLRPGAAPLTALAARLVAARLVGASQTATDLRLLLADSPAAAVAALVAEAARTGDAGHAGHGPTESVGPSRPSGPSGPSGMTGASVIVIVIDQLEELFTQCPSVEERVQLAAVIAQLAASADAPIRVIATIRDDFLTQLAALAPLRSVLSPAVVLLGNPSRDDLLRIVIEPARRAGYTLSDPELAHDMVSVVADRPGALALLSFTASRLWELRDRRFRQLTRDAYDAMGGVGGALGQHAEATLDAMSAGEQRSAREVFRHLVTGEGTRAVITAAELRQRLMAPHTDTVIDKLVAARLVVISEDEGEPQLEIIHEALIGAWPRLQHWVREDVDGARMRDQIRAAARQWQDRGRPRDLLWRGEVLLDLEGWLRRGSPVRLSELETAFVGASRRAKQIRRGLALISVVVVIALAASALAMQFRAQEVSDAKQLAERRLTQSYVEQGRHALLDGKYTEALIYLAHAVSRGVDSPSLQFMLARAAQPLQAEVTRLKIPSGRMWSARFSGDGQQIVTTDDKAARIWSAHDSRLLFTLPHDDIVYDAAFTTNGARLVTASGDGFVKIWDPATGALVISLTHIRPDGTHSRYARLAVSPDDKVVAAMHISGDLVDVWDASTGAALIELSSGCSKYSPALAFSSDGHWLAASCGDDVQVYEARTWQHMSTLPIPQINSMSFDPTGARLATGSLGGDAAIWEIPTGTRLQYLPEAGEKIFHVAFSPDGARVVTAAQDGAARVWSSDTGGLQAKLKNHRGSVLWAEFDHSSRFVVSAGGDGVVMVSDVTTGLVVSVLEGSQSIVTEARFDPSSRRVVGMSVDGTVQIWDVTPPYRRWSSSPLDAYCGTDASVDKGHRIFAISCKDHGTHIWDTAKDQLLSDLPSVTPPGEGFERALPVLSAAGDLVAIAIGRTIELYGLPSGRKLRTIMHPANVSAVGFASQGHDLVSACVDGSLLVTREGRDPVALPAFPGGIDIVGFAPDGRVIAAGARRRLRLYDPDRAQVLVEIDLSFRANSFRMSPDGRRMIVIPTSVVPAPPMLWDLENDRVVARLEGVKVQVLSARFVRDGREILTAGADGAARRWEATTGHLLMAYLGTGALLDVDLTPDDSMLVSAGSDGVLRFWDITSGAQIWSLQAHRSGVAGIDFGGNQIVTHGLTGEISRWEFPKPVSASVIEGLVRCMPLRFDEHTGGLLEQPPCDMPARGAPN